MEFMAKLRLSRAGQRTKDGKLTEAGETEPDGTRGGEESRRLLTPKKHGTVREARA